MKLIIYKFLKLITIFALNVVHFKHYLFKLNIIIKDFSLSFSKIIHFIF